MKKMIQKAYEPDKTGFLSIVRVIISAFLGFWLTASFMLLILFLFIYGLNENISLPSVGDFSGRGLTLFFDSWYSLVPVGAFVLIFILLLVLVNMHRIRRVFMTVGISAAAAAITAIVCGYRGADIVKALPGEWQSALIYETVVFRDFSVLCAVVLFAIGAGCLSVYFSIAAVKGEI